ncbi:MAG: glycosyltransferase family 39 protein [Chloroflexota bacterium]
MNSHLASGLSASHRRFWLLNGPVTVVARYPRLALLLFLWMVAGCVLFGAIFFTRGYPGRDSGVFLYIAQSILDGKIPYRDLWDHKPPGIFYVDALGLLLGRGSLFGVWLLESLSLCVSVLLCVKLLDRAFGLSAAFFGSVAWLAGLMLLFTVGGPNLQEEYAIPLKFGAFWLFLRCEEEGYDGWRGFLIGVTGALALLFRQNLIGVHLAIALYLLLTRVYRRRVRQLLSEWSWILLGGALVVAVVAAYFAANSALGDLIEIAFLYNFTYTAVSLQSKVDSSVAGFNELARSGLGVIAVASWLAGVAYLAIGRSMHRDARRLLSLAVVAFPLEVLLAGLSGRGYGHYYQAWLPVIAVLAGFFAGCLLTGESIQLRGKPDLRVAVWQLALALGMAMMPAYATIAGALPIGRLPSIEAHAAAYVREFTRPDDYVLVWGVEPSINFVSQRRSPTKYVQQYPLLTRGYQTPEMFREFVAEVDAHPPALIIDTSPVNTIIPPINDDRREGWKRWGPTDFYAPSPEMDELFAYLNANYKERGPLVQPGGGAVFVYERRQASGQW